MAAAVFSSVCERVEGVSSSTVGFFMCVQVAALFHIASTNEPPVIPPRLSKEGRNFLIRCFNRWVPSSLLAAAERCDPMQSQIREGVDPDEREAS